MGILNKLKNVFFEEEYVEVEEEVKPKPAQVAKKIELPENNKKPDFKEIKEEKEETLEINEDKKESSFRFPMEFDEVDFKSEEPSKKEIVEEFIEEKEEIEEVKPIVIEHSYAGLYEGRDIKKEQKKDFKVSPIISPIYGVLDKNYKKEEIVSKREIRLTTKKTGKNVDLDSIRQKAYGDLTSDITTAFVEEEKEEEVPREEDLLLVLEDDEAPAVSKVTVGDAEEYFSDLGLEYNVDYKDNAKESTGKRRSKSKEEDTAEEKESNEEAENNLFDLIDSMYEDKE